MYMYIFEIFDQDNNKCIEFSRNVIVTHQTHNIVMNIYFNMIYKF